MCRILGNFFSFIFLLLVYTSASFAQFPYTFIEQSHNTHYGEPSITAIGEDGLVFLSSKSVLRAYKFDGTSFIHLAHMDGDFGDIAVGDDGTLFAYAYPYGLAAFRFIGSEFQLISSINESWGSLTLGANGNIFFANTEYITAYKFDGTDFSMSARVQNLAPYSTTLDLSPETFLSATKDSMIYAGGAGGVYLYNFNGDSLILKDSIKMYVWRMDASNDGTLFFYGKKTFFDPNKLWVYDVVNDTFINKEEKQFDFSVSCIKSGLSGKVFLGSDRLIAFKYDGDSLSGPVINSSYNNIKGISQDKQGTIFLSDSKSGLYAFLYNDTTFTFLANTPSAGSAEHILLGNDGNLLLSNKNGIFNYLYQEGKITDNGFIQYGNDFYPDGYIYESAKTIDNTIITAGGYDGIRAFNLENGIFAEKGHITGNPDSSINIGYPVSVAVSKEGIIFIACSNYLISQNYGLHALEFDGNEFERLAYEEVVLDSKLKNNGCVRIDSSGNIFLGGDILQVFAFQDSSFTEIARLDNGMPVTSIAFGNGGIVYLTHGGNGISAYKFDGSSFTFVRHTETGNLNENPLYDGSANEIAVRSDGTIFLANGRDGLRAFSFEGEFFQLTAHYGYNYSTNNNGAVGVSLGKDGTVFLANSDNGLRALTYTPVVSVDEEPSAVIKNYKLYQNYPNPFNPETRIKYSVPTEIKAELDIYNILGEKVLTVVNGTVSAGEHEVNFNANHLPNGVYIYRLKAGSYTSSQKMVLIK